MDLVTEYNMVESQSCGNILPKVHLSIAQQSNPTVSHQSVCMSSLQGKPGMRPRGWDPVPLSRNGI